MSGTDQTASPNAEALFAEMLAGINELPASFTVPIEPPIKFNGVDYAELVLREPSTDQVRRAEEQLKFGEMPHARRNYIMHLIANVSGVPFPVVQKMGVAH